MECNLTIKALEKLPPEVATQMINTCSNQQTLEIVASVVTLIVVIVYSYLLIKDY